MATLDRTCRLVGYAKTLRVDQDSEFIPRDLDLWAFRRGVEFKVSRAAKPTDNAGHDFFKSARPAFCSLDVLSALEKRW